MKILEKQNKFDGSKKIRQSNDLIESPYIQEFTASELKIFEISMASCTSNDLRLVDLETDKKLIFTNLELARLLHTKPNVISMEIEKIAARIMKKTIHLRKTLQNGEVEFVMINIIPFAQYKNGILELRLNYSILPYLLEIKKNFTEFELSYLLSMRSAYAIKLYKLLYQYKNIKSRTFTVEELKLQFGIANKYSRYNDLKKDIIEPSITQINKLTNIDTVYKEVKVGRKITSIEFNFKFKRQTLSNIDLIDVNQLSNNDAQIKESNIESLLESIENITSIMTRQLLLEIHKEKGIAYIEASIEYAKKYAKTNFDKYLNDTLTKGWAEVEHKKSIAKSEKVKIKQKAIREIEDKDKKLKEQEDLNKSLIEHEWSKLVDSNKEHYQNYANYIITKYKKELELFNNIEASLYLSVFAVTNNNSYNKKVESYILNILNINLDTNSKLKK